MKGGEAKAEVDTHVIVETSSRMLRRALMREVQFNYK